MTRSCLATVRTSVLSIVAITLILLTTVMNTLVVKSVLADATHQAVIGMPFTGKWAWNASVMQPYPPYVDSCANGASNCPGLSSHPSVHHTPGGGNWATDIYAAEGTPVKLEVGYATGSLGFSWGSSSTSCGQSTLVNVFVNGVNVGWLYFAHINNAVTSGPITNGMRLGTVHDWGGCNPGVHVHIEFKNTTNYACYVDHGNPGVTLNQGDNFGVLGSTNTGPKQACTSVPTPTNSSKPGLGGGGASSWASGRLDAWIEQASSSGTSNLGHIWYDIPSGWHAWETIPGNQLMTSQPAVVSWGVNRVDVFARGQAGDLIHEWLDSGTWHGWESFGGCIVGAPTVTSWGPGRLDVMVQGCNTTGSNLYHIWYANNAWQPWELIPANQMMYSSPSAVSWGSGRIDLFSQGASGNLIHAWYDSNGWHAWESLGGCIIGSPAASSWGYGRLDGWVEGCNTTGSNFFHIWYDIPSGWHPFEAIPSNVQIAGVLGVVSWSFGRIDMFTRNSDNSVAHWWYDGAWRGPESKGGVIASD